PGHTMSGFLFLLLQMLVTVLWLMILGRVLLSWINPRFDGPVGRFLYETTEPLLAPIRRILPQTGMLDLSPLVLLLGLGFLMQLILRR
ncbi:MAG TPA: YggT family protein, partial [Candidatus Limnocylindrales bacterium]